MRSRARGARSKRECYAASCIAWVIHPSNSIFCGRANGVATSAAGAIEHLRIKDRRTLIGLLYDAQIRFGDAYSTGQIEVEGDLVKCMVALFQIFAPDAPRSTESASLVKRIAGWYRRPRRNNPDWIARQHPSAL